MTNFLGVSSQLSTTLWGLNLDFLTKWNPSLTDHASGNWPHIALLYDMQITQKLMNISKKWCKAYRTTLWNMMEQRSAESRTIANPTNKIKKVGPLILEIGRTTTTQKPNLFECYHGGGILWESFSGHATVSEWKWILAWLFVGSMLLNPTNHQLKNLC